MLVFNGDCLLRGFGLCGHAEMNRQGTVQATISRKMKCLRSMVRRHPRPCLQLDQGKQSPTAAWRLSGRQSHSAVKRSSRSVVAAYCDASFEETHNSTCSLEIPQLQLTRRWTLYVSEHTDAYSSDWFLQMTKALPRVRTGMKWSEVAIV